MLVCLRNFEMNAYFFKYYYVFVKGKNIKTLNWIYQSIFSKYFIRLIWVQPWPAEGQTGASNSIHFTVPSQQKIFSCCIKMSFYSIENADYLSTVLQRPSVRAFVELYLQTYENNWRRRKYPLLLWVRSNVRRKGSIYKWLYFSNSPNSLQCLR